MSPLAYSYIVTKNLVAEVSKNAPRAPECTMKTEIPEVKLRIQYKKGNVNSCGVHFEKAYVEHKISQEIESFSNTDHHVELEEAAKYFKTSMKYFFPDSECVMTGSLAAGVDVHTSDLDFSVKVRELDEEDSLSQLKMIGEQLKKLQYSSTEEPVFKKIRAQRAHVPVLQLVHAATNVSIDVTIDSGTSKRNTQLLRWYGQVDRRFPLLCKAVKTWASKVGVEGSKRGKLNSFSICLMLINYLQVGVSPAVLPNLQETFPELDGEFEIGNEYSERNLREEILENGMFKLDENKSSLAALFLGFLKYYSEFDFRNEWISVKRGKVMKKRRDEERNPLDGMPENNCFIVVEDPFLTVPRNCAGTVRQTNFMERIQKEFGDEYSRILNNKTIFNLGPSNWNRRLVESGKERDLQIQKWENENKKTNKIEDDDAEWGTIGAGDWEGPRRMDPEEYWELKFRSFPKQEPWPTLFDTRFFSI